MDLTRAYLARLGFAERPPATAAALAALHRAHLARVPFENLDIHAGRPIVASEARAAEKVALRGRGGFCYELNGAFALLLRDLGFPVALLSARVAGDGGKLGAPFDHLALRVEADGAWLADVGFGEGYLEPLRLDARGAQSDGRHAYRLAEGAEGLLYERDGGEGWTLQYVVDPTPRAMHEFAGMCRHHQTSPESPFTRQRVVTRPTEDGRLTLTDRALVVTRGRERTETPVGSRDAFARLLREHFAMDP